MAMLALDYFSIKRNKRTTLHPLWRQHCHLSPIDYVQLNCPNFVSFRKINRVWHELSVALYAIGNRWFSLHTNELYTMSAELNNQEENCYCLQVLKYLFGRIRVRYLNLQVLGNCIQFICSFNWRGWVWIP